MNRIQEQANKFWQTLSAPETVNTYKDAGRVTWNVLRELAILLWLVICLGLVAIDWFWNNSIQAGRNFRSWLSGLEPSSPDRIASEAGKALLAAGKGSLDFTLTQAREQLGLPLDLKPAKAELIAIERRPPEPVANVQSLPQEPPQAPHNPISSEPTSSRPSPSLLTPESDDEA